MAILFASKALLGHASMNARDHRAVGAPLSYLKLASANSVGAAVFSTPVQLPTCTVHTATYTLYMYCVCGSPQLEAIGHTQTCLQPDLGPQGYAQSAALSRER